MSRGSTQDKYLTVFSSEGRLHQIEYAFKAVNSCGLTSVALRGESGVAVCIQKKVPDKMIDPDSVTQIFNITDKIGCVATGHLPDANYLVMWMRYQSAQFKYDNGYDMPVHVLANKLGNYIQMFTQQAALRPLCTICTLVSIDEETGPQIFKVDPAGYQVGYRGTSSGTKENETMTMLEKQYKKVDGKFSDGAVVETVIDTLQTVISSDFKATDIEVGVATASNPTFRKLANEEIDLILNKIADKY